MRDFLDEILAFIGSESLTDEEFNAITLEGEPAYTSDTYDALRLTLEARDNVGGSGERLLQYFQARGVEIATESTIAASNIFLGADLGDDV